MIIKLGTVSITSNEDVSKLTKNVGRESKNRSRDLLWLSEVAKKKRNRHQTYIEVVTIDLVVSTGSIPTKMPTNCASLLPRKLSLRAKVHAKRPVPIIAKIPTMRTAGTPR